jgi:ubiquinone/menaquinone biosynthesis C-methylase UbiE
LHSPQEAESQMPYNPHEKMIGGFSPNDGTIEFYGRINSVITPGMTVLDLGAGRAEWFEDGRCQYKKQLQLMKGKVKEVIATDVAPAVLSNQACDRSILMSGNKICLLDESVDVVIADWVLEHIETPDDFKSEVDRVLKPGGYFFARTPHGASYLSVAARLVPNRLHSKVLKKIQPDRKPQDVFPTFYRLNSLNTIRRVFSNYLDFSYIFRPNPAYFFGSKFIYKTQTLVHRLLPAFFYGFLYVCLQKGANK